MRTQPRRSYSLFALLGFIVLGLAYCGFPPAASGLQNSHPTTLSLDSYSLEETRYPDAQDIERAASAVPYTLQVSRPAPAAKLRNSPWFPGIEGFFRSALKNATAVRLPDWLLRPVHVHLFHRLILFPKHGFW